MGGHFLALLCILQVVSGSNLVPHQIDYHLSDHVLGAVMDDLNKELPVAANDYLGKPETSSRMKTIQAPVIKHLLPAYCNPPDPDSVGFTEEERGMEDFEDHRIKCSDTDHHSRDNDMILDKVTEEVCGEEYRPNLVTNKHHFEKNNNPFFIGDRLPEAANDGINLYGG